jgi:glycosyltransferase involved in cell wall biosynthesis
MRILFILPSLATTGGGERGAVDLLAELARQGHECSLAALWPPYDLEEECLRSGVTVHRLNIAHRWLLPQGVPRLAALIWRLRPNVLHAHMFFSAVYLGLAAPAPGGPPRIVTFQNVTYDGHPAVSPWHRVRKRIDRWSARQAHATVAVSDAVARHHYAHLGLTHTFVIPNSVPGPRPRATSAERSDVRRRHRIADGETWVVCTSRMVPQKDHDTLLAAVRLLRESRFRIHVHLVGDGPLRAHVVERVGCLGLDNCVTLMERIPHDELLGVISSADLVVLSSLYEGLPVAAIEALAAGTPFVGTHAGGTPEVVSHLETGLLVPPSNPVALARAMATVFEDPMLGQRMARAGARRVAQFFSVTVVAGAHERLYTDLLLRLAGSDQQQQASADGNHD